MKYTNIKLERNAPCWCGSGRKYKQCHMDFDDKIRLFERQGHEVPERKLLKSAKDIAGIRASAEINMAVLDEVAARIRVGMTTEEINTIVHEKTLAMGGTPAPLHYEGYPKSVCTSVNEEVCHGIPSGDVVLKDGDIVNVDASTFFQGYYSDSSRMFCLGDVSPEKKRLVEVAKECMEAGIRKVVPWTLLGDVGAAVNAHARANGCRVVREIGGHGCGLEFHEDPWVGYTTAPGTGMLMVPGMVFTIEPMVNMGREEIYMDEGNGWTIRTADGKPSAQWEVQVLVTDTGCEILSW